MATMETRTTDAKGRLSLPRGFANATVIVERISDSEVRIRKARIVPEDEFIFVEEAAIVLSNRDRDLFLSLLANPPRANKALKRAAARSKARRG
jgi:hypothetical protein